jgi:succinyl-CoA synthetase alpha subunit
VSIFVDEKTTVVVQGLTGGQGRFHGLRNRDYGTKVVGGITPGKGGTDVEGVPVFDTVAEAVEATGAVASFVVVPPRFACDAILEAAAAGISFIVCITEGIPAQDEASAYNRLVREFPGTRLLGPNCPGIISPGKTNIGITSGDIALAGGPVGIVSRSGTLTYQALHELSQQGVGQTTCVGIGGDPVPGTNFIDCLEAFEADPDTRAVMMIGEIGGSEEERAAEYIGAHMTKPVVAYVAGVTAPPGRKMGHAGAIISGSQGHRPGQDGGARRGGCGGHGQPDRGRGEDGRDRPGPLLTARPPAAIGRRDAPGAVSGHAMRALYRGRVRVAVLVSGSGTILDAMLQRGVPVVLVLSDRPCAGLEVAARNNVDAVLVDRRDFGGFGGDFDRRAYTVALTETLRAAEVDLVAMAGFGTVVDQPLHDAFAGRILNTHPALLPAFPGWHAVEAAHAAGVKVTGCTVHLATLEMDAGPILAQETVPVRDDDTVATLHERIKTVERRLYPETVLKMLNELATTGDAGAKDDR